jgi:transposase-like protein
MVMPTEKAAPLPPNPLRWKDLDGQQKYEVVELARQQKYPLQDLCRMFGVTRQTLYRAMEAADRGSVAALEPKPKGRPAADGPTKELAELRRRNRQLESDLKRQQKKVEVAKALLDLHRKLDRGQSLPGEKKSPRKPSPPGPSGTGGTGWAAGMAKKNDR